MKYLWCLLSIIVINGVIGQEDLLAGVAEGETQNGGALVNNANSFNSPEEHPFFWNVAPAVNANQYGSSLVDDENSFGSLGKDTLYLENFVPVDTVYNQNTNQNGAELVDSEKSFSDVDDESFRWLNIVFDNAHHMNELDAKQDEFSYEDASYSDKKDSIIPKDTVEQQNILYEVDYLQPKFYDYSQFLFNKKNELESKIDTKIDDTSDIIFIPEDYKTFSNIPSDAQKEIMTFFESLKPQISTLKIVEIKRDSIIFIPSLESLRQKAESTYYANRRNTEYMERSSSRGAFLFLGIILMTLGSLFIILLIKLRSNHKRLRVQMSKLPVYERMPNEEV